MTLKKWSHVSLFKIKVSLYSHNSGRCQGVRNGDRKQPPLGTRTWRRCLTYRPQERCIQLSLYRLKINKRRSTKASESVTLSLDAICTSAGPLRVGLCVPLTVLTLMWPWFNRSYRPAHRKITMTFLAFLTSVLKPVDCPILGNRSQELNNRSQGLNGTGKLLGNI